MTTFDNIVLEIEQELSEEIVDKNLLSAVMKACGPSIYSKDGSILSSNDKNELLRVKKKFLIKRLGLSDGDYLDEAIQSVIVKLGNRKSTHRALVYYFLVKEFKSEDLFKSNVKTNQIGNNFIEQISNFGVSFLDSQEDIDPEIKIATEENFKLLLL